MNMMGYELFICVFHIFVWMIVHSYAMLELVPSKLWKFGWTIFLIIIVHKLLKNIK